MSGAEKNAELLDEAGEEEMMCCASCGTAGGDEVTLKNCNACHLVRYCSVKCQREHWSQHKLACKKRSAELKDEILFKQPESSYVGDCPICLLPIPIPKSQDIVRSTMYSCCSKVICNGCIHANILREIEARLPPSCPFCRHPTPKTDAENDLLLMKRVEANDPVTLHQAGMHRYSTGDIATAIDYWKKASQSGDAASQYKLSSVYHEGWGVQKDLKKFMYHLEQAAIGGHDIARYNLGAMEERKGNDDRAAKHWIIAANLGCDPAIKALKGFYAQGVVSKEDFGAALRAYQGAVGATKSPQRDAAEAAGVMQGGV